MSGSRLRRISYVLSPSSLWSSGHKVVAEIWPSVRFASVGVSAGFVEISSSEASCGSRGNGFEMRLHVVVR